MSARFWADRPTSWLTPALVLDQLELGVEVFLGHAQGDLAEQLDEAPVGVVAEALVAGLGDQALQGVGVQAQVEDGVHHARHGHGGAGAHRHQQRVVAAAEGLAGGRSTPAMCARVLLHDAVRQTPLRGVEIGQAGLGGDDEARRHAQADLGHLAQVGALAAEQFLVLAVAFVEGIDPFRVHSGLRGLHGGIPLAERSLEF
jgi:hypothetical protein